MSNKISVLAAALFAAAASAAGAVSLGDLDIQSIPGQPLDATLEVKDVDLTISPLLVRVAPPATYLREGVQWPQEALDLRMARLSGEPSTVRVRVTGTQSLNAGFPLLIELNAGGNVTVREYRIERTNGSFSVVALSEEAARTKAPPSNSSDAGTQTEKALLESESAAKKAAAADSTLPEKAPEAAKSAKNEEAVEASSAKAQKPRRRIGRAAPVVVREYVALNGFNPNESFRVQRDMTLWSIAKLYWPSYPGALLEQVAVALTDKNPNAFVDGDPSRIVVGQLLASPAQDEVFAIDPLEAFRKVHGNAVEVPGPTQNLIDAQKTSRAGAAEVAAAQLAASAKGEKPEAVAEAGRRAFDQWKAETSDLEEARTEKAEAGANDPQQAAVSENKAQAPQAGESVQKELPAATPQSEAVKADSAADAQSGGVQQTVSQDETASETKNSDQAEKAPASVESAASDQPKSSDQKSGPAGASSTSWGALAILVIAIFAGLLWWRRREGSNSDDGHDDHGAQKAGTIAIQRNVPPATEAQLKAVDATIDEAVKNGTTAGAMGAGAMAYAAAQMAADRKAEAPLAMGEEASAKTQESTEEEEKPIGKPDDMLSSFEEALKTPLEMTPAFAETAPAEAPEEKTPQSAPLQDPVTSRPAPADQPWLKPDDAELPPLETSEVESAEALGSRYQGELPPAIQKVNLNLDDLKDEEADASAPAGKMPQTEAASQGYVPPLTSEPVTEEPQGDLPNDREKGAAQTGAAVAAPHAEAEREPERTFEPQEPQPVVQPDKQEAQQEAIDAKLSLAGSFIGLGATNEARELLEEVKKSGSEHQRERAVQLLERLGSAKA